MPALFLVDVTTTNPALMAEYRTHTPGLVGQAGGRFVVRGGATETVEGDWRPQRVVMIEFPDIDAFRRFYDGPDYQPVLQMRLAAGRSNAVLFEGEACAPSRAFLMVELAITDPAKLAAYREHVPALVAQHGGRYVARSDKVEAVEGDWRPERLTIVGFPDMAALRRFYFADAYKPLLPLRLQAARCRALLVEGV
ncbi:MAG TPA: DUF1330 domain-containing protein [Vineibacter sp.]|nr:DUF1330 domain-containing protein [Vineibacter sp.]